MNPPPRGSSINSEKGKCMSIGALQQHNQARCVLEPLRKQVCYAASTLIISLILPKAHQLRGRVSSVTGRYALTRNDCLGTLTADIERDIADIRH